MDLVDLAERGFIPDWVIRTGIRRNIRRRLGEIRCSDFEMESRTLSAFVTDIRQSPLLCDSESANQQHYEVPAAFFRQVLGPRMKYSSCFYPNGPCELQEAEEQMLELTCGRAELSDGMKILDLGCGWGSLTLWIAQQYPHCHVTGLSNSNSQRAYILSRSQELGLDNVTAITADIRNFETDDTFDRVVSVEMFEHLRNYELLLRRIAGWLNDRGKLFVHLFCHRQRPYLFETDGQGNWMGRNFFTGGMMPSEGLLLYFQNDLKIQDHWRVDGGHYARTCDAWLANLDRDPHEAVSTLQPQLDEQAARVQLQRWRIFFMACSELFRYRGGHEWFVSHYLFRKGQIDED